MGNNLKLRWWHWLPFQRWRILGTVDSVDEVPEKLPRNGVVIVPKPGGMKWMVFDCPCGSGHRIVLNADLNRKPVWRLNKSKPPSIFPSVDYRGNNMRCHYFIQNGRTVWARDAKQ